MKNIVIEDAVQDENSIKIGSEVYDVNIDHFSLGLYEYEIENMTELLELQKFPSLVTASFPMVNIDDIGLSYLSKASGLENINLQETDITNEGLKYLTELKNLKVLRLKENEQLNNDCANHLSNISQLEELQIHGTSIDEKGLAQIADLKKLKKLVIELMDDNYSYDFLSSFSKSNPGCNILVKGVGEFANGKFEGNWPT